jgi:hypothetical protein
MDPMTLRFVVDKVTLDRFFSLTVSVFPCQYRSTSYPYSFFHALPTLCDFGDG